jgi:hypothetical protein
MWKSILATLVFLFTTVAMAGLVSENAYAKDAEVYTSWRNNLSAGGYDVVSFHQGNPVKGNVKISTDWREAQWLFASKTNQDLFEADPEKYAPAYGGYCAWALAKNKLAKGSPEHWTIKDGRLYLNFNKKIKNRWLKDTDNFITQGDGNWPNILAE